MNLIVEPEKRKVIIIVPSQGMNASHFKGVAKKVNNEIYDGRALILETTVTKAPTASFDKYEVRLNRRNGQSFAWAEARNLKTVMTISHGFSGDGPNLAFGSGGYQPWGRADPHARELSEEAKCFWGMIGVLLRPSGKIIMFGCMIGAAEYAQRVANLAQRSVFAPKTEFAAANFDVVQRHLRAIEERGVHLPPTEKFSGTKSNPRLEPDWLLSG